MKRYFLLLQMLCTSFALQAATWTDPETNLTWSYEPFPQGVMITNISSYPEILEIPATINNLPVKEIGYQTFYNCSFMTSVTIPEGVVEIGEAAFEHCVSLTSITFPKSLKRIDRHAFNNCKSLESIDIPKGLEYLGEGAFSACPSFVYDDSGATFEGDARKILIRLQPMFSAATYEVPSSVRFIQSRAFHTCSRLVELTLNDGLLAIGKEAFYNCSSLTSLTLPESLRWLDDGAFAGCQWLKAITFQGPPPRMREPFSNRTIFNSEDTASTKLYDCEVRKVYYPAKYATAWQHQIDAGKWSQVIPVATADVLISLQTLGGGTITPAEGDLYGFANGTTKTLTATPAEGYLFMGWSGDVVSDQSTITLTDEKSFYRLCAQFLPLSSIEAYLQSVGGAGGLSLQAVEALLSEKIAQGALVTLETATDAAKREAEATLQAKIDSKELLTQAQIDDLSMQTPVLDLREGEATLSLTLQKATHLTSNAWEKVKLKAADVDEEGNLFLTLTPEEDEDTVFYKFVVPNEQF